MFKRWRRRRVLRQSALSSAEWRRVAGEFSFIASLSDEEERRLKQLVVLFLDDKKIHGAGGLEVSEEMRLRIAVQACILILNLDLDYYAGWVEIIVYPDEFIPEREYTDEAGVV